MTADHVGKVAQTLLVIVLHLRLVYDIPIMDCILVTGIAALAFFFPHLPLPLMAYYAVASVVLVKLALATVVDGYDLVVSFTGRRGAEVAVTPENLGE